MTDERIEIAAQAMFEAGWPTEESRKLALKNNPSTLDGYRKLARAALAALGDGRAVVSVKPLAWSEYPAGGEQAIAAGLGLYRVHANGDDWYLVPDHMGKGGKAAAQADYAARVRSTLIQSQTAELETVTTERDANHHLAVANGERAKEESQRAERAEARIAELEAGLVKIEARLKPLPDDTPADDKRDKRLAHSITCSLLDKDRQK